MDRTGKRKPLYTRIRDHVLANIHQGSWQANDRLPTEVELAEKFGVSRFTVKKALSDLVEEGLIYRIQGKGSFISPDRTAGDADRQDSLFLTDEKARGIWNPVVLIAPSIAGELASNLMAGAEEWLSEHGYQLVFRSSKNEQATERRILNESVHAGARGVLVFPVDGETYNEDLLLLTLNKFPVVVIDRYLRGVETNCVCSDHAGGAYDATKHLIELGHREIAYVALHGKPATSLEERLSGYEKAMLDHRIPPGPKLSRYWEDEKEDVPAETAGQDPADRITAAIRDFLALHPSVTAVFAATAQAGLASLKAAEQLGRKVPEQLSVIFFDDYVNSAFSRIPPSCVVQQEKELGAEAAKLLLSVIRDPAQERRRITLPTRLVLRESTAPPHRTTDGES